MHATVTPVTLDTDDLKLSPACFLQHLLTPQREHNNVF